MAKIYYRRYMERVNAKEITIDEAITLAEAEVPAKWKATVVALLEEEKEDEVEE